MKAHEANFVKEPNSNSDMKNDQNTDEIPDEGGKCLSKSLSPLTGD